MLVLLTNSDHSRALQHDGHVVYQNSYGEDTIYLRVTPEYAKWLRRELEKMESERPDLFGAIDG